MPQTLDLAAKEIPVRDSMAALESAREAEVGDGMARTSGGNRLKREIARVTVWVL